MRLHRWSVVAAAGAALLLVTNSPLAAQGATITGRITAQRTGAPIGEARVLLLGSPASATTSDDGRFILRNVRSGVVELQAFRVGYASKKHRLTIGAGETVTADITLADATVQLQEIVITGAGAQRRQELGNSVTTYGNVTKKVEEGAINTLSDLMQSKAAGVIVLPPTTLG